MEIFTDPAIADCLLDVVVLDPRGEPEAGEGKRVALYILTDFWNKCFTSLTVGRKAKMPFIRHDMQKHEWESFARILLSGYKKYNYFPVQLSPCLLHHACLVKSV